MASSDIPIDASSSTTGLAGSAGIDISSVTTTGSSGSGAGGGVIADSFTFSETDGARLGSAGGA